MILEIVSPEATLFKGEVTSVSLPGVDGSFQILNNHAPIVSILKQGTVKIAATSFEFENGVIGRGNSSLGTALGLAARLVGDFGIIEIQEAFWNSTDAIIKTYQPNSDIAHIEQITRPRKGAGYVHMIEAVSNSVLAGDLENSQHTHAFSIEVMRSLDKTRADLN